MSGLFISDAQNVGALASASVLPMNIQGWLSLLLTGLITYIQYSVINHNVKDCLKEYMCVYIYICITESLFCTAEIYNIVNQL